MTKAISNLSLYARNIATRLDEKDGNKDNKITASVWNDFVKDKGGKQLKYSPFISLENAQKSISSYIFNLHLSSHTSVEDISNSWTTAIDKKAEEKANKEIPTADDIPTADGTPLSRITKKEIPFSKELQSKGLKAITERYDGNRLIDKLYFYTDGKIVKEYKDPNKNEEGKSIRGNMRDLVHRGSPYRSVIPKKGVTEKAKPISISLPKDASENAYSMAKSLVNKNNKAKLMSLLKIDNKTYNEYARLTLAIADRETNFGEYCRDGYKIAGVKVPFSGDVKYAEQKRIIEESEQGTVTRYRSVDPQTSIVIPYEDSSARDEREKRANAKAPKVTGRAEVENDALSCGFTQIKWDNIINSAENEKDCFHNINKSIKDAFEEMGITKASDLYNPEKCAIATLIWMSYIPDKLEIEMQEEHAQRKNQEAQPNWNLDSHLQVSIGYNGNEMVNIKLSDIIACRWNTSGAAIQDGAFNPKNLSYISDPEIGINRCLEKYTVNQK